MIWNKDREPRDGARAGNVGSDQVGWAASAEWWAAGLAVQAAGMRNQRHGFRGGPAKGQYSRGREGAGAERMTRLAAVWSVWCGLGFAAEKLCEFPAEGRVCLRAWFGTEDRKGLIGLPALRMVSRHERQQTQREQRQASGHQTVADPLHDRKLVTAAETCPPRSSGRGCGIWYGGARKAG